jgi:peptide/nickel transport system ATP-binding protein
LSDLLDVSGLSVAFGSPVVQDVSFRLTAGQCLAVVGESGSGKSVTARALVGLSGGSVSADRLVVGGEDVLSYKERQWRRLRGGKVGFVLQDALTALDPLRTVGAEVAEPLSGLRGDALTAEVVRLLTTCGIPDASGRRLQYAHELSGGLRQRALIATAIAAGPPLLIADEPTTALDVTVQRQILDLLAELKRAGTGLLLISHDLAVVAEIADQIAVMDRGRIVEHGPAAQVLYEPSHQVTRELLDAVPHGRRAARTVAGPVLEASGVSHRYAERHGKHRDALVDVDIRLNRGETLGVVGESGSGKSTLARVVLGLLTPSRGRVLLDGQPWSHVPERVRRPRRRTIQFVPQNSLGSLDPRQRIGSVLAESLGDASRERIEALLTEVGLTADLAARRPAELSGGQRQRVAIARALATEPEVLVCDEPVSALDARTQATILRLLVELQDRRGLAMLFISHDLGVVREVSDRVVVMKDGQIVETGDPAEVFEFPTHPYTKELVAATLRIEPR